MIKKYTPGPFVFILPSLPHIEKKVYMKRKEIGVRIPSHKIPIQIVEALDHPIFSVSASKDITSKTWWDEEFAKENLLEFGWELDDIRLIDLIIDTGEPLNKTLSTVINLTGDEPEIIRQGIGIL